jgi:uncharacterized ferritin-like protein (DUF455 family)
MGARDLTKPHLDGMDGEAFASHVEERARDWFVNRGGGAIKVLPGLDGDPRRVRAWIVVRLKQGYLNEIEACHVAARWLLDAPIDVKRMLARQVEDEARHMDLLGKRLRDLGEDPDDWVPMRTYRRLFDRCLDHRGSLPARMALENFGAELISASWGNVPMIEVFSKVDPDTAALYHNVIQKDEQFHTAIGRTVIRRYSDSPEVRREVLAEQDWLFSTLGELKAEYNERLREAAVEAC